MKTVLIFHFLVLTLLVVCACAPWLLLLGMNGAGGNLGLGIGYISIVTTPLSLVVAGVYGVAALTFHFIYTGFRRSAGKPPLEGYLLTWIVLAGGTGLAGLALLILSALLSQASTGQIIAPVALAAFTSALITGMQ